AIALSDARMASGLDRNTSRVSALQVTPWFFSFSLGPRRLLTVPALRPTTPNRLGPTIVAELASAVEPWQVEQLARNSTLPLAASPFVSPAEAAGLSLVGAAGVLLAQAASVVSRAVSANRGRGRIADMDLGSPEYGADKPHAKATF